MEPKKEPIPKELTPFEQKQIENLKDKKTAGFMKVGYAWLSKLLENATDAIVKVLKKDIYKVHIDNLPPSQKMEKGKEVKVENFPIHLTIPKDLKVAHNLDSSEIIEILQKIRDKEIKPTDLSKMEKGIIAILGAIQRQELVVNVDAPDQSKIVKAIESLKEKIIQQVLPVQKGYLQVQLPESQMKFLITEIAKQSRGGKQPMYGVGPSGPNFEDHDDLSSQVDGANKVFTLKHKPEPGASLYLVYNGTVIEQKVANYTLSGKEVTTVFTPETDTEFWAGYRY